MNSRPKTTLIAINLLGGLLVLGSYVWGFLAHPNAGGLLWGGVPATLRPIYTISMFLAAGGYFAFSIFILQLDLDKVMIRSWRGAQVFNSLYTGILIPSALWLPLTMLASNYANQSFVWLVRVDLLLVALAALGLLYAILHSRPQVTTWSHRLAIIGGILFCFQTVILDAIIWSIYFHL